MGLRILQFGDVHLPLPAGALGTPAVLHPRRIPAVVNYFLRRGRHYAAGTEKLAALAGFLRQEPVDWIFYAGDSVNMGLESEFRAARPRLEEVFRGVRRGVVAVPGNHDFYTRGSVGAFRRTMPAAPGGEGIDVRRLASGVAVAAFETAHPHLEFWNSSGRLDEKPSEALRRWLDKPETVALERIFLLTHYPPDDSEFFHGLRGTKAVARLLFGRSNVVFLHGHVHKASVRSVDFGGTRLPVFCSGSLTKEGVESFWLHEVDDGGRMVSLLGRWSGNGWCLEEGRGEPAGAVE